MKNLKLILIFSIISILMIGTLYIIKNLSEKNINDNFNNSNNSRINHIVIVMQENRAFDHIPVFLILNSKNV